MLADPTSGINWVTWVIARSSVTGKMGPTPEMEAALWTAGIRTVIMP